MLDDYRPGGFIISGLRIFAGFLEFLEDARLGTCGKDVIAFGCESFDDLYYLFGRLTRAVYHLRKAAADLAMVVDCCKAELLKWKVPKPLNRLIDTDIAVLDLL